ncbi:hypothetical protein [Hydrogenophaga sp.]|uniref:hypothetical protein n=1 Tax=Hydrogenophaga sp. TaxID=1904254 RepID=UPI003F71518A
MLRSSLFFALLVGQDTDMPDCLVLTSPSAALPRWPRTESSSGYLAAEFKAA